VTFYNGILNLTNWMGNVIMPTLAGLFFALAVIRFARGWEYHQLMYAGFLALMASGLLRAMETFTSQRSWDDPDLVWNSLLNLVNWTANVILPLYGTLQLVQGALEFGGLGHRLYPGSPWLRHFLAAGLCFMLSGFLRLAEWFIEQGAGGVR